jgi:hypothetical protein
VQQLTINIQKVMQLLPVILVHLLAITTWFSIPAATCKCLNEHSVATYQATLGCCKAAGRGPHCGTNGPKGGNMGQFWWSLRQKWRVILGVIVLQAFLTYSSLGSVAIVERVLDQSASNWGSGIFFYYAINCWNGYSVFLPKTMCIPVCYYCFKTRIICGRIFRTS